MRIFLLGDSFTENLFQIELDRIKNNSKIFWHVTEYLRFILKNELPKPLYYDDYLKQWGYEIINLAELGCSMEDIIYQFSKIDKNFQEGDRIIINWTSHLRYNWIKDDGEKVVVHSHAYEVDNVPAIKKLFMKEFVNRDISFLNNGYLNRNLLPFLSHIVDLHSKYKPIMWCPFKDVENLIKDEKWFFYCPKNEIFKNHINDFDKILISDETYGTIPDYHYSRYGNFYLALIMKTVLEYGNTEYYTKEENLLNKIIDEINNNPHNIQEIYSKDKKFI